MILNNIQDGSGVFGGIFHYSLIFSIVGSTFLLFLYLWSKGKLDMDEEPKEQMMREDLWEDSNERRN